MNQKKDLKEDLAKIDLRTIPKKHEIMRAAANQVCLELHLAIQYEKTKKEYFRKLRDEVRKDRKELMRLIEGNPDGELHCIYKHLLYNIGGYQEIAEKSKLAEKRKFLEKSYKYYKAFWGLRVAETK